MLLELPARAITKILLRDFVTKLEALSSLCNKEILLRAEWLYDRHTLSILQRLNVARQI